MPIDLPESKSKLKDLAARGIRATERQADLRRERKERRNEVIGALVVLPLMRDLVPRLPLLGDLGLDPRLELAALNYGVSVFSRGMLSDAAWGATLGAVGAYTYMTPGLLAGILGNGNGNGNGNGG